MSSSPAPTTENNQSQQAQIQIRFQEQEQVGGEPIQIKLFILNKIAHVVKLVAICPAVGHGLK